MNFWFLLIVLGIAYLAQLGLSIFQLKDFSSTYGRLRRRGKVAIGKRKNAVSAGAIAMFLIDNEGIVREAEGMTGLTVFARFKPIKGFEGLPVSEIGDGPTKRLAKGLRLAVLNARDNWLTVQLGQIPEEPPGPLIRLMSRMSRKKKSAQPAAVRAPHAKICVVRTEGVTR
ncbi:transcriptional regulator GutM [Brooklawnia sp.]|uniref:transcriptional regulator GutM n=1 Tax=Brooklawnia sp. TaxID=2699740 RepID=UPI00311FEC56